MRAPVHLDDARPCRPHEEHVYLLVDVLIYAPSRRKPHQVGIELCTLCFRVQIAPASSPAATRLS